MFAKRIKRGAKVVWSLKSAGLANTAGGTHEGQD
jgi:hypothetical protein